VLRAALGIVAAGSVGGCGLLDDDEPVRPDPLDPLLAGTVALAARYDAAIGGLPQLAARLTPIRDAHRAHATALAQLIGRPASSLSPGRPEVPAAPSQTSPPATAAAIAAPAAALAELRAAEKAGQAEATAACLAAPADRTAVLGSITAARATHQEALK
jgi:hypothetical protein